MKIIVDVKIYNNGAPSERIDIVLTTEDIMELAEERAKKQCGGDDFNAMNVKLETKV